MKTPWQKFWDFFYGAETMDEYRELTAPEPPLVIREPYPLQVASRIAGHLLEDEEFWPNNMPDCELIAHVAFRQTEALIKRYTELYGHTPTIKPSQKEEV